MISGYKAFILQNGMKSYESKVDNVFRRSAQVAKSALIFKRYGSVFVLTIINKFLIYMLKMHSIQTIMPGIRELFNKKTQILLLRDGTRILYRKYGQDLNIIWENFINEQYISLNVMSKALYEIKDDDVVVDIGAQIGTFTLYAARKTRKGKVFAFEPNHDNYTVLEGNRRLNTQLTNIEIFEKALHADIDKRAFYGGFDYRLYNPIYPITWPSSYIDPSVSPDISFTTLREFMNEQGINAIDFLKIDCDGAEYEILLSLPSECYQFINNISLEYHKVPGYSLDDLLTLFQRLGYATNARGTEECGVIIANRKTGSLK